MTKKVVFFIFLQFIVYLGYSQEVRAYNSTLSSFGLSQKVILQGNSYIVQQSIGQSSMIGTFFSGDYTLRQGFIQPLITTRKTTLIKDEPTKLYAKVFPNPFANSISIVISDRVDNEISVILSNVFGQVVLLENHGILQEVTITPNVPSGIYILKVSSKSKSFTTRIIKE